MFCIKKKSKPIKLEMYTWFGSLIDLFPPRLASSSRPDWLKAIPPTNDASVKHCHGVKDLYNEGVVVPSWADFDITIRPQGQPLVVSSVDQLPEHSTPHPIDDTIWAHNYVNTKLHTPWFFYCEEMIKWAVIQPVWEQQDPLEWLTVPGIIELKYQNQVNANMIFKRKEMPYGVKIRAGDPLTHLIPLSERPLEIEVKIMTQEDWSRKFNKWHFTSRFWYHKTRALLGKSN